MRFCLDLRKLEREREGGRERDERGDWREKDEQVRSGEEEDEEEGELC